jgi:hypothetical protein
VQCVGSPTAGQQRERRFQGERGCSCLGLVCQSPSPWCMVGVAIRSQLVPAAREFFGRRNFIGKETATIPSLGAATPRRDVDPNLPRTNHRVPAAGNLPPPMMAMAMAPPTLPAARPAYRVDHDNCRVAPVAFLQGAASMCCLRSSGVRSALLQNPGRARVHLQDLTSWIVISSPITPRWIQKAMSLTSKTRLHIHPSPTM